MEIAMGDQNERACTVFIVDDEPAITDALSTFASMLDLTARSFSSAAEFLQFAESEGLPDPACLIVDVRMPKINGLELIERLTTLGIDIPAIVMTGHGDESLKQRAEELGAVAFLEKPFRPDEFKEIMRLAVGTENDP
jgi:FixJ family two-component response regulator